MKFSVIVPVYNVEKYLKKCIDSIVSQTYKDFELIIVDDGSTDGSEKIYLQYKNIPNVVIIKTKNQGSSKARWEGINCAKGEYVVFIDSDDFVSEKLLEVINQNLDKETDLLQFSYMSFVNENSIYYSEKTSKPIIYDKKEFLENVVKSTIVNGKEAVLLWNKVYKREKIIENMNIFPHSFLEDYIFNCEYYVSVNKYKKIDNILYFYRCLPNSLSKRINPNGYEILKEVDNIKSKCLEKMGLFSLEDKQNSAAWFINYLYNLYLFNACLKKAFTKTEIIQFLSKKAVKEKCCLVEGSIYDSKIAKNIRDNEYFYLYYSLILKTIVLKLKRFIKSKL